MPDEWADRKYLVEAMPNAADPDTWPDIGDLPGRLLLLMGLLEAQANMARWWNRDNEVRICDAMIATLTDTREALIKLTSMSALEAWRLLHPPNFDAMDSEYYGCRNPECDNPGRDSAAHGRRMHKRS